MSSIKELVAAPKLQDVASKALPVIQEPHDWPDSPAPGLYVDVDGTLIYSDLLYESFLLLIKKNPLYCFLCLYWLLRGRNRLKSEIAGRVSLDASLLCYNEELLAYLKRQRLDGRRLVLASASDKRIVQQVADHLGIFDAVIASDETVNLKSRAKLRAIQADAAGRDFVYAGDSAVDLPVWEAAHDIIVVNAHESVVRKAARLGKLAMVIPRRPAGLRTVSKALRLHQWAKNALLFVPLLAAHDLSVEKWLAALLGFIAFGLCASATYVINDLLDLASDRAHPRKRERPFAAGTLSIRAGFALVAVMLPLSMGLSALVSLPFLACMVLYTIATLSYSMRLKQVAIVDALVLALLYTHRVLAGGVATGVVVSNWLLAVSLFIFLSLALVKRCVELEAMIEAGRGAAAGRGYRTSDLPYLISMGIASGFAAVLVLALYIERQTGGVMYPHAELLWLILPVALFWIMRLWLKISRMEIHDDPLLFAITDRASWFVAIIIGGLMLAASFGSTL